MWYFCVVLVCFVGGIVGRATASCDSDIYCSGRLLDTVQRANLFVDSKTFVDMEMSHAPDVVRANFLKLMEKTKNAPCQEQVRRFVKANFQPGNELVEWKAPDFNPNPPFLSRITDSTYRAFIKALVPFWGQLSRKLKPDVFKRPERYSIIPVPNGFVIPGGRFKEFYYWDSYWIVKGLLASDMHQTVRGMIENFLSMVERYGFVPNGGRVYYLNRSQPPLLTLMVHEYIKATNDLDWLKKNVHLLQKELKYWIDTQTVTFKYNGIQHTLAHYSVEDPTPRPESYMEDVETCAPRVSKKQIKECYNDLKSGAETGWDFSSRWIFNEIQYKKPLTGISTRRVLPVDLNSFLAQAFGLVSNYSALTGDVTAATYWNTQHKSWKNSIRDVLYHQHDGIWYDFDLKLLTHRRTFYPSNLTPLWSNLVDTNTEYGDLAAKYIKNSGILKYKGGIPTSLMETGEQWDFPNAWPPLQSLVILGLKRSGSEEAMELAKHFADLWLDNNFEMFNRTGLMYEKYNAEDVGTSGGGGEYTIQTGFGWTNGEIFELVEEFYSKK